MQNQDILIHINGEPFVCSAFMKLIDILSYLDFNVKLVTIEYNKEVISNSVLSEVFLHHNDEIEIVTIVGGG
uniref:Thiamine biosynthesis protein S n=1 Tax=Hildenbrandia rivularis TaxID=135206 RepID=A0A1C9CFN0_9FLOR|nr:thiamine biosynthesis protein S [Hildenbrandia rivularis]AOM67193.1 thiamine biosynthesis protein S [Hildenbrandia rivularis]